MQDSKLPELPTNAICIHAEKSVVFARNVIKRLNTSAWKIEAAGQVLFDFNSVEYVDSCAFCSITPEADSRVASIVFVNNTVKSSVPDSLITSDMYPRHERKVLDNKFNLLCECNISVVFEEMMDIQDTVTGDNMMHQAVLMLSLCKPDMDGYEYMRISEYLREECSEPPILLIVSSIIISLVLIATILVAIAFAKKAKKAQEEVSYLGECSSRSFSTINTHALPQSPGFENKNIFYDAAGNPSWIVAVPEVKTYQETEVNFPYEESEPMRNSRISANMEYETARNFNIRQSCPYN